MRRAAVPTRRTFNLNSSTRKRKRSYLVVFVILLISVCVIGMVGAAYLVILQPATVDINSKPNANADSSLSKPKRIGTHATSQRVHNEPIPATPTITDETNTQHEQEQELPKWIEDYINWHQKMRAQFPGQSIITDPNAPPVLVRTCLGLCGGLHDRLGQLPLDLYIANQTKRVLLIKWIKPQPLEEFLVPPENGIDWVFPPGVNGWATNCFTLNECAKQLRAHPAMKGNIGDARTEEIPFGDLIDGDIKALNEGELKDTKAVTFAIMGHLSEDVLEGKLRALGETDMIHGTPTFGNIFRRFFQPHPKVQTQIDLVYKELGMVPGEYSIAHCRVRHPKAYPLGESFNGQYIANADKTGLPFEGRFKDLAVNIATRAIDCAATLPDVSDHPIYFMSDSSDLVDYMTRDLLNETYVSQHPNWFSRQESANATAKALMSKYQIVARDQDIPNAHIDKNKGRPPEAYYATFVDLYLGINARCVSFGIGCYAIFAAKLSGTTCKIRYATEKWGVTDTVHKVEAEVCSLPEKLN